MTKRCCERDHNNDGNCDRHPRGKVCCDSVDGNGNCETHGERPGTRIAGTVVRVLLNKGYCFVRGEDRNSYFAHAKQFVPPPSFDSIREGTAVEFCWTVEDQGRRAVEVVVL